MIGQRLFSYLNLLGFPRKPVLRGLGPCPDLQVCVNLLILVHRLSVGESHGPVGGLSLAEGPRFDALALARGAEGGGRMQALLRGFNALFFNTVWSILVVIALVRLNVLHHVIFQHLSSYLVG